MFSCSGCGACCRAVGKALSNKDSFEPFLKKELENFPFKVKEDGSCEKLKNGKCEVYEERPLICNVDKLYDTYFKGKIKKNTYYKQQTKACNSLVAQW